MLTARNEFETVEAFTNIAGCSIGTESARQTTVDMLKAVETTTGIHGMTTDRLWKELAELSDEETDAMFEIQEECALLLDESMPMPAYCSVTLQDNEWTVIPYIDEELDRVSDHPDFNIGDHVLLVNDHGNVDCLQWDYSDNEYKSIWAMV